MFIMGKQGMSVFQVSLRLVMVLQVVCGIDGVISNEVNMGTTIMAAKFDGGVVVGADTRTSVSGYVSNRMASKLTFVSSSSPSPENNGLSCCICRSGSAADTQHLAHRVRLDLMGRQEVFPLSAEARTTLTVSNVAHLSRNLLRDNPEWSCSLICAGYDETSDRGSIFNIAPTGALIEEPTMAMGGSGSSYVAGHVDRMLLKRRRIMSLEECVDFVGQAIELAMARDGSSGGFVRLFIMDRHGCRQLTRMPPESLGRRMGTSDVEKNARFAPSLRS